MFCQTGPEQHNYSMSLLTSVETAIKSCKDEQARVNGRIQLYKDLLHSLTAPEEPEPTNDALTDPTTSFPEEIQEMMLLEKALEKALCVRTGKRLTSEDHKGNKPTQFRNDFAAIPKKATLKTFGNPTNSKTTLKSTTTDKKAPQRSVTSSSSSTTCGPGRCKNTTRKNGTRLKTIQHHAVKSVQQTAPVSITGGNIAASGEHRTNVSDATSSHDKGEMGDHSLPQPRRQSKQKEEWIYLRHKQNRMWDKVMAAQRKPAAGRSRFMERMRATFPKDWPSGSPEQIESLVDRLTDRVAELDQQCQTMNLLDQQTSEQSAEAGLKENCRSCLTPETLQTTATELRNVAERAKQAWEAWDRCKPEAVCLHAGEPVQDEAITRRLPVTVTYASEAELRQLEAIRMRVALLQQEVHLQQALVDALSPQLASIIPSCTNRSVLRDLYSLLGEGGQRFPAIVLDSEPEGLAELDHHSQ
ncbi:tubulin epsilon and delta complex protein 2 isoform X1 [Syngnathus acus]|uniref:tubulin epsilon and delta complex protein 2 isoform X1 n=1 Tax=Syngnathus acus TaxID=161584 RepID=UPI001885B964|nr:tubulin epsilon and delta complex protein 2 isoform X1 [Syngnathus acus]